MQFETSCGAVVITRNAEIKYLLLHYEAGHWDFVKGNIEPNETEEETVRRELKEETGITQATFIKNFRETIKYFYKAEGKTISKRVTLYLIETSETRVNLSFEHVGYEWLNYQQALERLTFKTAKQVLNKAQNHLKNN
jgi:8-oxo-dGTP pyrophosphatase MutT (NUDIX family)